MAGTTHFLCSHPNVLRKAQHEVRSAFKNDAEITPRSVNDLTYMIAVLTEALRVFPPSPFVFTRILESRAGQRVAGRSVPYGVRYVSGCPDVDDLLTRRIDTNRHLPHGRIPLRNELCPPE